MAIKCQHSDHLPPDEKIESKKSSKDEPESPAADPSGEDVKVYTLTFLKHDWFEKGPPVPSNGCGTVIAHLYIKQIIEEKLDVQLSENKLQVTFATSNKDFLKMYQGTSANTLFSWNMILKGSVDVARSKCKIRKAFLEVNLAKKSPGRWGALEMPLFLSSGKKEATVKEVCRNILEDMQPEGSSTSTNGTGRTVDSCSGETKDMSSGQAAAVSPQNGTTAMGSDHTQIDSGEPLDTEHSGESLKFEDGASASREENTPSPNKQQMANATTQKPERSSAILADAGQGNISPSVPPLPPPQPPVASCSTVKVGVMGGSKSNGESHVPFDEAIRKAASRGATKHVDASIKEEEDDSSLRVFGYTGLENLGNTCYMNSIIQCLVNTRPLRDFFLTGHYKADVNTDNPLGTSGKLAMVFATLMRQLWSGQERYLAPYKIKSILGEKVCQFKGFMQQDAQEFMSFFLDGLHEDLNRIVSKPYTKEVEGAGRPDAEVAREAWKLHKSRNDSIVVDLFQGQLKSKLTCPVCKKISIKFDPFMNLSVPLPKEQRLLKVYVLFKDPKEIPLKVVVRICQNAPVEQLQKALHKKLGILPENMRIFEAYRGKMRTFERGFCFSSVISSDVIVCSEVLSEEEAGEEVLEVPVMQRTLFPCSLPLECAYCQKRRTDQPLKRCTRCWNIGYCNQSCQTSHWKCHRKTCRKVSPQAIGVPFVLSLPASQATFGRLQEMAEEYAKYSVDVQLHLDSSGPETQGEGSAVQCRDSCASTQGSTSSDDSAQPQEARFFFKPVTADGEGIKIGGDRLTDQGDTPLDLWGVRLAMDWRNQPNMQGHVTVESKHLTYREHPSCQSETLPDEYSCTLQECLELFTEPETLSEDDAWYCPECKAHRQATKQLSVWRLPEILIVHLKRFSFRNILFRDKITKLVDFPISGLDMSPFTLGKGRSAEQDVYDLFAVTNHSGTVNFGHYTAFARLSKSNCADVNGLSKNVGMRWRYFDDRCVSDALEHRIVSKYAYVLFYRRRSTRGSNIKEKTLDKDTYPAVPRAPSVTSQETGSTPPEEQRASLEDVDENELD